MNILDLLMQEYMVVFIMAVITTVFTIMMRSFLVTLIQVLLLLSLIVLSESAGTIQFIFIAAQIVLSGIVIYKIIMAIDMNYRLVLEKTHQTRPDLINDESRGSRFSFWRTN
ncbi:hypothetical protein ACE1TG_07480 [Virgibacillus sp. JSM 102003]